MRQRNLDEAYREAEIFISPDLIRSCAQKIQEGQVYNIHFSLLPKYKGVHLDLANIE